MPKHICDFRCWYAKGSVCKCWCCGLNHGVGRTPEGADEKYGYTEADYELHLKKLQEESHETELEGSNRMADSSNDGDSHRG